MLVHLHSEQATKLSLEGCAPGNMLVIEASRSSDPVLLFEMQRILSSILGTLKYYVNIDRHSLFIE